MMKKNRCTLVIEQSPPPSLVLSIQECRKVVDFFSVLIVIDRKEKKAKKAKKSNGKGSACSGPCCLHTFLAKGIDYCLSLARFVIHWLL